MKKIIAAAAFAVIGATSVASAADMAVKARPMVADAALDWSGFYVGVNGGYGWQEPTRDIGITNNAGFAAVMPEVRAKGGFGGGQIGYNWQRGVAVFGIEADFQGADIHDSYLRTLDAVDTLAPSRKIDFFGTVRGRLGFLVNNTLLLYGTGGFAYGDVKNNYVIANTTVPLTATLVDNSMRTGYVGGAGAEYAFNRSWSVKAEYQFIYLGSSAMSAPVLPANGIILTATRPSNEFHTVRVGINYHLNQPIVAQY